ncbi:hypothetical protein OF83DRAFT_1168466 [Amylostereum chailletii]|nr:hypothetical protein OF83DRAFT_1168466 [Amylostereum chailletii]
MSSYESLRAAGTSVVCLSPWGDSSPFLLPCIRFRDLAVHTVVAATGGMAAIAAPVMGPVADVVVSTVGDSILVEVGMHAGFHVANAVADDLFIAKPLEVFIPKKSAVLQTTSVKTILVTLKYKQTMTDAALGFYRSSLHKDNSLFSTVKDYLAVEKGWFSPYLFASGRRPIIPRAMTPDVMFCHGPFLSGDYKLGETLLQESATAIVFAAAATLPTQDPPSGHADRLSISNLPSLSSVLARSRTPSPEPTLTALAPPPMPRRMVLVVVGLKPHRRLWSTSARPSESVMYYHLLNGCPALVVPVKTGAPLVAWDGLTLEEFWKVNIPEGEGGLEPDSKFEGIVGVLAEFLEMCVDWERLRVPKLEAVKEEDEKDKVEVAAIQPGEPMASEEEKREELKKALRLLVAGAIRSGESKAVRAEVDKERSGIAMWRIL